VTHYNETLSRLQKDIARCKQLTAAVEPLRERKNILESRVRNLKWDMEKEQAEADRLESRSLTVFFLSLRGKLEEKRSIEQAEARAARIKYDAALRELEAVTGELEATRRELATLRGCELRYDAIFKEKQAAIRAAGGADGEALLALEEKLSAAKLREKELTEAVQAGEGALQTTRQILASLDSAKNWGTWDLVGGGLISDLAKHSHLDDAQAKVERLQGQLRRFRSELSDVQIRCDLQLNVDSFLRFADVFFDGLLSSWAVLDRIGSAREQVLRTQSQIENVLSRLKAPLASTRRERDQLISGIDALVLETH
jgi:DNA repair exonuclease SbcCD ATPase subunit